MLGFETLEVVGLVASLIGLIPVATQYTEESKWFTVGYLLLVTGMIATNLENVVLGEFLNVVEHGVGIGLAGLVFFAAAYLRREEVVTSEEL